ncbi:MAG: alkaline phosphatase D family protein, partial [Bacteroidia bacterium]|nr:alkaline phosphatase D family protein [Bacteroidia bacterium]MDW8134799.1 alkaline phosphatase D family protein [Bacteroidia bacterium]
MSHQLLPLLFSAIWAQVIVGGVTETTASLCIWDTLATLTIAHWKDRLVKASEPPISLTIDSLLPHTLYTYQVRLSEGKVVTGSFHTPPISPLRVAFISCHELMPTNPAMSKIYKVIEKHHPHLVIHLGDWGYPDTTEPNFPPRTHFFPERWSYLKSVYEKRYKSPQLQSLFQLTPWAYVYDDHDYVADNTGRNYRAQYRTLSLPIGDYPFNPTLRQNAIRAYELFFPHYPLIDSNEGIFQSFRWGDVEFFLLDNRSARTGTMQVFEMDDMGRYSFRPKPEISIIGNRQREWLLNALKNSQSSWKVVLSGVTYNRNLQFLIKDILSLPEQKLSLVWGLYKVPSILIAGFIADTWAGYPADQDTLLSWCWSQDIRGVLFISGDTHIGTLEDGTMGGFPELMTGGLGKVEKRSYRLAKIRGASIFNRGGQGISSRRFLPC